MRKICKKCKLIFKGTECPICHSTNLADGFRGKIIIIDPENSELAKKLKKEKQNIVINKIDQKFGSNKFDVDIFVYDSYEGLKKYNKIPKKTKAKLENPDAQSETAEQS